jgi:hypothetical protein
MIPDVCWTLTVRGKWLKKYKRLISETLYLLATKFRKRALQIKDCLKTASKATKYTKRASPPFTFYIQMKRERIGSICLFLKK